MYTIKTEHWTRFSDFDTQHHVTSRTYEYFCEEARFALFATEGYSIAEIAKQNLAIIPTHSHVNFHRQQMPNTKLICNTVALIESKYDIFWHQQLFTESNELVAEIFTITYALDRTNQNKFCILKEKSIREPTHISLTEIQKHKKLLIDISGFNNSCKQLTREITPLHSLRNLNWQYGSGELWRFFEDGRWILFQELGMDHTLVQETDTTAFFMGATFRYFKPPEAGNNLIQKIWIERINKIRLFFRQEIYLPDDLENPILSSREFVILVSVSKSKPKRPNQRWLDIISPYMEYK